MKPPAQIISPPPLHDETLDHIGPYVFVQKKGPSAAQRLTADSLLLADFVLPLKEDDSIIELGTGSGAIPLLLASRSNAKKIVGVEIEPAAAKLAARNARINGLQERVTILEMDFRGLMDIFKEGSFSVVLSNPPYVKAGSGRMSPSAPRASARAEVNGTLADLIAISSRLAGSAGRICYVFPKDRLDEMQRSAEAAGLTPKRIRFVKTRPDKDARLFLAEFRTKEAWSGGVEVEEVILS